MSDLLARCAHDVALHTRGALDPQSVLGKPGACCTRLSDLHRLLQGWQAHYLRVRGELEATEGCARWEFGRAALFDKTHHARDVAAGLTAMLTHAAALRRRLQLPMMQQHGGGAVIPGICDGDTSRTARRRGAAGDRPATGRCTAAAGSIH